MGSQYRILLFLIAGLVALLAFADGVAAAPPIPAGTTVPSIHDSRGKGHNDIAAVIAPSTTTTTQAAVIAPSTTTTTQAAVIAPSTTTTTQAAVIAPSTTTTTSHEAESSKDYSRQQAAQMVMTTASTTTTTQAAVTAPSTTTTTQAAVIAPSTTTTTQAAVTAPSTTTTTQASVIAPSTTTTTQASVIAPSTTTTTQAAVIAPSTTTTTQAAVTAPSTTTTTSHEAESSKDYSRQQAAQVVSATTTQLSPATTNPLVVVHTNGEPTVNNLPPLEVLPPYTRLVSMVPVQMPSWRDAVGLGVHMLTSVSNHLYEIEAGPVLPVALTVIGATSGARLEAAFHNGLISLAMALPEPLLPLQPPDPLKDCGNIPSSRSVESLNSPFTSAAILAPVVMISVTTKMELRLRSLLVPSSIVLDITNPPG